MLQNDYNNLAETNLEETYREICQQAKKLLEAEFSTIILAFNGNLVRVYATHPIISNTKVRKNGRTYKTFTTGKPFVSKILGRDDIHPKQYKLNVKSIVFIPLKIEGKPIGVLNILSRKDHNFSKIDMSRLETLESLASLSIRNAQLLEENKQLLTLREIFFAAASHELKTPLTTIKLYGQLIANALKQETKIDSHWGSILSKEVTRVTRLINEFWLTDQIKTGHLVYSMKKIHLKELVNDALLDFQAAYSNPVTFKTLLDSKHDIFKGDFDRLLGALTNILNNAGKHSPNSSSITVKLIEKSPYYLIQVKDKGPGISKTDKEKIFEAFYKSGKREGIGLGLFLAKHIIDAHQGKITINSRLHVGTTVNILLPHFET